MQDWFILSDFYSFRLFKKFFTDSLHILNGTARKYYGLFQETKEIVVG